MFTKQTIRDIDLNGKTVLLRADYNVPLEDGRRRQMSKGGFRTKREAQERKDAAINDPAGRERRYAAGCALYGAMP